jgi:hypothetical protein
MLGIHDVFPADSVNSNDPISKKKLQQLDGEYSTTKNILGFDFNGINKTIWLEEVKPAHLLTVLHGWIRLSKVGSLGTLSRNSKPWWLRFAMHLWQYRQDEVCSQHATRYSKKIIGGISPANQVLLVAVMGCQTLLWESSDSPT